MCDTAEEVIGLSQIQNRSPWFDKECSQGAIRKNQAYTPSIIWYLLPVLKRRKMYPLTKEKKLGKIES